uniref:hypothetical protein n=1 Tax=Candidatus Electronema sp. TaxID=2698783 RepID=UPI00405730AF
MPYNGYLNTDLDLLGEEPFNTVLMELGSFSILHYGKEENGTWSACIESQRTYSSDKERRPEDDILPLIKLISKMSATAKEEWRRLTKRDFNIGYEATNKWPQEASFILPNAVLQAMAAVNATCSVTIYPYSEENGIIASNENLSEMQTED